MKKRSYLNNKQGLYNPANEHDACGVGLVVNIHGGKSHDIVESALKVLENMRCLLYTSPSPRDQRGSRMPSSA